MSDSNTLKVVKIQIIWDRDDGPENEGYYVRRHYSDGHEEDDVNTAADEILTRESSEAEVISTLLYSEEIDADDITIEVRR